MFDSLQKSFGGALKKIRGLSKIQPQDVDAVLAEVRTGLLEADVHFRVVKDFLARVRERCLRVEVLASLTPEQQVLKILSEELTQLLGGTERELKLSSTPPAVLMVCGLQGAGKTTSVVKLALHLKKLGKNPGVVSVDVNRPAAMDQLKTLAERSQIHCFRSSPQEKPLAIAERARKEAHDANVDVLLLDTAGRLQVDDELMAELETLKNKLNPTETLLVLDAMTGQQAVEVAEGFDRRVSLTGSILTKLDGDARGGAALSLVAVTGKPIKFIGTGERPADFEPFRPERMASRLLDMGDVLSLLEKAESVISADEARDAAERLKNPGDITLQDFRDQLKMLSRMGPLSGVLKMLPGMGELRGVLDSVDTEKELKKVNAMIDSMTPQERRQPDVLNGSRKARVAAGSGTQVQDVNQLVKRFLDMRKMMKQFGKLGNMASGMSGMGGLPFPGGGRRGGRGFGRKL
jgi:signal recognition particle subunit SRP54